MSAQTVQGIAREFLIALANNEGPNFIQNEWFNQNDIDDAMRRPVYELLLNSRLITADVDETFTNYRIRKITITVAGLHQAIVWPAPEGASTVNITDSQIAIGNDNSQEKSDQ